MTLRHLKLFIEVYRTKSITQAANLMNMTQPTVTRAIHEIEEYYQIPVFDRINHRLQPTEAGDRLYLYASKVLDLFEHMDTSMREWNEAGILNIGATQSIGSTALPRLISEFKKAHPNFQVRSTITNSRNLQRAMENGELDFALIEGFTPVEKFHAEPFSEDRLVILLPPDDIRAGSMYVELADFRDDDFLLQEKGSEGRSFVEALFAQHHFPIRSTMESASTHAIVQAVHAGLGIAVLPYFMVQHSIESGFVATCRIQDVDFRRQNYIVWHEGKYITASMQQMIELCRESE